MANEGLRGQGFRFVWRGDTANWVHPALMVEGDIDCTDMSDDEFEALVFARAALARVEG